MRTNNEYAMSEAEMPLTANPEEFYEEYVRGLDAVLLKYRDDDDIDTVVDFFHEQVFTSAIITSPAAMEELMAIELS